METLHIVVLALIQGLTEFLPISSSAHLILPSQLLGWPDQGLVFDVALHIGSLVAVVGYFHKDILQLIKAWFASVGGRQSSEGRLAWFVIVGTIPTGVMGLMFEDFIETHLRSILVIAATTMIFGVLLGLADKKGTRTVVMEKMTLKQAVYIGLAQAIALIPGTSRSGITMTAGLALGLDRQAAARFSFLLSIPIIVLSGGFEIIKLFGETQVVWKELILGTALSAISAITCIHLFLTWIDRIGMMPFVIYRLILGVFLLFVAFA